MCVRGEQWIREIHNHNNSGGWRKQSSFQPLYCLLSGRLTRRAFRSILFRTSAESNKAWHICIILSLSATRFSVWGTGQVDHLVSQSVLVSPPLHHLSSIQSPPLLDTFQGRAPINGLCSHYFASALASLSPRWIWITCLEVGEGP